MFIVDTLPLAILFCILTMLGWGSWANTQKLAGKEKWPFELFYWDYAIGVFLFGVIFAHTLGVTGSEGMSTTENLHATTWSRLLPAFLSGAVFNVSNILLVVGIGAAGMSVAFPVGVGLALVIGTVKNYLQSPKGNPTLLFGGVALILFAMIVSARAHARLRQDVSTGKSKGLICSIIAGCLMGFFYPLLIGPVATDFRHVTPPALTPYVALFVFGAGVLVSNLLWNTIYMRVGGVTYRDYFRGSPRLHAIGILGGLIWMAALCFNVIASGVAGPAISYALGQGATLIAAIWGVFIWKEFRGAPEGTAKLLALMFGGYAFGLLLIGAATL